MVMTLLYFLNY